MEMMHFYMPYMDAPEYPREYRFLASTELLYRKLPKVFRGYFDSFGKDSKEEPPKPPQITQVSHSGIERSGADASAVAAYTIASRKLTETFRTFYETSVEVSQLPRKSAEISTKQQEAINGVIKQVSDSAPTVAPRGTRQDDHILSYLAKALEAGEQNMSKAVQQQQQVANEIDKQSDLLKRIAELEKQMKNSRSTPERPGRDHQDRRGFDPPTLVPPAPPLPDGDFRGRRDVGGTDITEPSGPTRNAGDRSARPPYPPAPTVSPAAVPAPGMSDLLGGLSPLIAQQMMARNLADQGLVRRPHELDPRGNEQGFDHSQLGIAGRAPATIPPAPATTPPSTATPPSTSAPPPRPAEGTPPRAPDADGDVEYTFPDGRTQKVTALVAQVLDAAIANKNGTDAHNAYSKTKAQWSDTKSIGQPVDPHQLITGDVGVWSQRTAVVVVWSPDDGGAEAVIDGELVKFPANGLDEMSDKDGAFGTFAGFRHPNGIESAASDKTRANPLHPGTGEPSTTPQPADTPWTPSTT